MHPIQCDCGRLKGELNDKAVVNRCVCYCADCQAFARFLGHESEILDEKGGTEVIQTTPDNVTFGEGAENLACMKLTPGGVLRWYAKCCNTPIGNTSSNFKLSFVGLIHNCLEHGDRSLADRFGPVRTYANPTHARGEPKPKQSGMAGAIARILAWVLKARLNGGYRRTPFFDPDSGKPVAVPRVLTGEELDTLKAGL